MPDKRKHRGPHPEDRQLFARRWVPSLRLAVEEYAWLLTRGYAEPSALALAGNHHGLTERQRLAVRRSACSDQARQRRRQTRKPLDRCLDGPLGVDGYNLLITVESALSGGVILIGRDGCCRDLASVHGTYRKVEETLPAIESIAEYLGGAGIGAVDWYLDRPVSNSGRLRSLMTKVLAASPIRWNIDLVDDTDGTLAAYPGTVATSDSWILDRCTAWVNLAADIIESRLPEAWTVDLR